MNNEDIIKLQEATKILYWYSRDDYLGNYPNREYDKEIKREQEIAAATWKLLQQQMPYYYQLSLNSSKIRSIG